MTDAKSMYTTAKKIGTAPAVKKAPKAKKKKAKLPHAQKAKKQRK